MLHFGFERKGDTPTSQLMQLKSILKALNLTVVIASWL